MPDSVDRTDIAKVQAMTDADIDYSDIPALVDNDAWGRDKPDQVPKSRVAG